MTINEVMQSIIMGSFDEDLNRLRFTIREREKLINRQEAALFKATVAIGAKVQITNIRPKYLIGKNAVVSGMRGGNRVDIMLDTPVGKYSSIIPISCPASCLKMIG